MSGVSGCSAIDSNKGFYSVIGCKMMELPCELVNDNLDREECCKPKIILENDQKEEMTELMKTLQNTRKALCELDIINDQIDRGNKVMIQHDCRFIETIVSDILNILHGNDLLKNMDVCEKFVNK